MQLQSKHIFSGHSGPVYAIEIKDNTQFKEYFNKFFDEDKLKKIPAGFDKNFAEPELLKLKHYLVEYKNDDN